MKQKIWTDQTVCEVTQHFWEIALTQRQVSIEYLEVAESLTSAGLLSSALPADGRLDGDEDVPVAAVQRDGGRARDQPRGEAGHHQQHHQQHLALSENSQSVSSILREFFCKN